MFRGLAFSAFPQRQLIGFELPQDNVRFRHELELLTGLIKPVVSCERKAEARKSGTLLYGGAKKVIRAIIRIKGHSEVELLT